MGKALRDGYRQKAFLMTKIDGRTKEEAAQADRRIAAAAADGPCGPAAAPRGDPLRRPGPHLRARAARWRRSWRRRRRASSATSVSLATKIRTSTFICWRSRGARVPVRYRADAAERHGRALPELRKAGAAGTGEAEYRRAGNEEHGERRDFEEQDGLGRGVPAICAESADLGSDHRDRQPADAGPGDSRRRGFSADEPAAGVGDPGEDGEGGGRGYVRTVQDQQQFDSTAQHPEWLGGRRSGPENWDRNKPVWSGDLRGTNGGRFAYACDRGQLCA